MKGLRNMLCAGGLLACLAPSLLHAQEKTDKKDPARPPQVRTYTSVRVVDDPTKAPRLPSQRNPSSAHPQEQPKRSERPAGQPSEQPAAQKLDSIAQEKSQLRENNSPKVDRRELLDLRRDLRRDLRDTAKELRKADVRKAGKEQAADPQPRPASLKPGAELRRELGQLRKEHLLRNPDGNR
jgi:type IV secretory pathway VirB10-like protein